MYNIIHQKKKKTFSVLPASYDPTEKYLGVKQ